MKVKRYLAPDMRRALAQIREEMGEDAVMLSNRSLEGGVEVVAASLPGDISFSSSGSLGSGSAARSTRPGNATAKAASASAQAEKPVATPRGTSKPVPPSAAQALAEQQANEQAQALRQERERVAQEGREMHRMRSELNGIRRLLEQRLSGMAWEQFSRRTPVQAGVWERLNAMGVPAGLSKSLLETLRPEMNTAEAWRFAIAALARQVPVLGTDIAARGGIFAFLGPTGVGKTTTIGKLATRYVLEHGPEAVALVTTDSFRVAAHEQLRTFGRILGVTVRVVDETHSLPEILASLRHKSLVLIDTAGLNAKDPSLQFQLQTLRNCPEVQNILVMACTSQASVLATAYRTYAPAGLSACVLSKLDEAGTIGEALSLVIENSLPVVYETHGQNIPNDIKVAQAHNLVSKAVALSVHSDEESERLMMEFGNAYGNDLTPQETQMGHSGIARGGYAMKPVQVLAITGGKGGVGKTNVSVNLGLALAEAGKRVILMDADLGLANVDIQLGIKAEKTLAEVMNGECSLRDVLITTPGGLKVIPAASGVQSLTQLGPAEHAGLIRAFSELDEQLDVLLIDTAAGISESVISFVRASQEVLVVVCDEPSSITDAYALVKLLHRDYGMQRFRVLANMTRGAEEGRNLFNKFVRVAERFLDVTLQYAGDIPWDDAVRKSAQRQKATLELYPSSKAAIAYRRLAQEVLDWPLNRQASGRLEFFVERLLMSDSAD